MERMTHREQIESYLCFVWRSMSSSMIGIGWFFFGVVVIAYALGAQVYVVTETDDIQALDAAWQATLDNPIDGSGFRLMIGRRIATNGN